MSEGDLVPSVLFFPSTLNALPEIRKKPADPQEISRHRFVTHSLVTEVTGELVASTARSGTGRAARSGTGRSCTAAVAAAVTARSGTGWGTAVRRSITAGVLVAALLRLEALLHQATEAAALLLLMAAARGSTAIRRSRSTARSGWGTAARSSAATIAATIAARSGTGRSGTGIAARSGTGWAARSGTARSRTGIAARRCTGRSRVTARVPVQLEQASVGNTRASNDQQGSGQSRPLHLEISRVPGVTVRNR